MRGKNNNSKFEDLRRKAEQALKTEKDPSKKLALEINELIHELEIHQIELEMQNEDLLKTQMDLEDSRRDYYELFDFAPVGYFTLDENGIIKIVNLTGTEILGTPRNQLIDRAFIRFITPQSRKTFHEHFQEVEQSNLKKKCIIRLKPHNETSLFVSLDSQVLRDEKGDFKGLRTIVTDVTQLENAEERAKMLEKEQELTERLLINNEELKQSQTELTETINKLKVSNSELEQFAYVAAHDLQEPLRMVGSFTQLLELRYKDQLDEDANEYIGFIVDGSHRMKCLIDDLLIFSELNNDTSEFILTDLNNVLDNVLSNLKLPIGENNAQITVETLPNITCDHLQIRQLFQNLIVNSIKFHGDEPPKIHISSEKIGNEWKFSVRDNGIGIDPEHHENIFNVFNRLHTREKYEGTGIGLSIDKRIVARHGGRIWVESEEGKGSTFYFTIPNH